MREKLTTQQRREIAREAWQLIVDASRRVRPVVDMAYRDGELQPAVLDLVVFTAMESDALIKTFYEANRVATLPTVDNNLCMTRQYLLTIASVAIAARDMPAPLSTTYQYITPHDLYNSLDRGIYAIECIFDGDWARCDPTVADAWATD
jgi:hypothetical protein